MTRTKQTARPGYTKDNVHWNELNFRGPEQEAVGLRSQLKYDESKNTTTEYTIPIDIWNEYIEEKGIKWDKFHHKLWRKMDEKAQDARLELIKSIDRVSGLDHNYYLCIPVEARLERGLPESSLNCSNTVLRVIGEVLLRVQEREREEEENVGEQEGTIDA